MLQNLGLQLSVFKRRSLPVGLIVVFNAAWLYGLVCTSLCTSGVCYHQSAESKQKDCHDQHRGPSHRGENGKDCSTHNHLYPVFMRPASSGVSPDLPRSIAWAESANPVNEIASQHIGLPDALSHSPPGFASGRT